MNQRKSPRTFGSLFSKRLWTKAKKRRSRTCRFEQLEARRVLAAAIWNNAVSPLNVNGDPGGFVAPNDVLAIVNELNGRQYSDPATSRLPRQIDSDIQPPFFDVTCDGFASPIDVLQVVNFLNSGAGNQPGDLTAQGGTWANASCSPQLIEGSGFATELTRRLTLPDDTSAVKVLFHAPEFDTSSDGVRDAFEIEVTDTDGNPIAFAYQPDRDANYNWTEGQGVVFGPGVQTITEPAGSDSSATIYLAGQEAGTEVVVRTRLVNNDGDNTTNVIIRGFEIIDSDIVPPAGQSGFASRPSGIDSVPWQEMTDLSSSLVPNYGRTSLSGDNTELISELAVTNQGRQAVMGRVVVVVENVSDLDASPLSPDGFTPGGDPFYDLSEEMDGRSLGVGDTIRSREIRFRNTSGERFRYNLRTLGNVNRAPGSFTSQPGDTIEAGRTFRYTAAATDPEAEQLAYSLNSGPSDATIDPQSGELTWAKTLDNVGQHRFVVRATDPHGLFVEQSFNLDVKAAQQNRPPVFVTDPVTEAIASSGFEITTVGVGDSPAGAQVISGFRGPRIATINSGDQTLAVHAGENNDRFDDTTVYSTSFPAAEGQLFDVGYAIDIGLPDFVTDQGSNGVLGMDQGDINGDGITDFTSVFWYDSPIVGERYQLQIASVLGNGDGTFSAPEVVYSFSPGTTDYNLRNLQLRDLNTDGQLDLVLVDRGRTPRLISLLGNGDGTFQPAAEQTFDEVLSDFHTVDVNDDGVLDLIGRTAEVGFGATYEAVWLQGIGDGSFADPIFIGEAGSDGNCCYQTQQRPYDALDLNGDDNIDLAIMDATGLSIYFSDGNGNFSFATKLNPTSVSPLNYVRGGDFTGDGIPDIIYNDTWNGDLVLLTGDGSGTTFETSIVTAVDGWLVNGAGTDAPTDIDGDGDLDLLFGHSSNDWTSPKVAINDGNGDFTLTEYPMVDFSPTFRSNQTGDIARGAMFGDYNADGVTDYVYFTTGDDANGASIRLGTRPGKFGTSSTIDWVAGTRSQSAAPGDFNGDGLVDLIDWTNDYVSLGVGAGQFQSPFPAVGVSRPSGHGAVADFNLDGIDDIVAARANQNGSRYYVGLANGDGTFTVSDDQLAEGSFYGYNAFDIDDFNQDGFPDLIAKAGVERHIDVHINDPENPGVFTRSFRYTLAEGSQGINVSNWQESFETGDFTGDGISDIIFAERESGADALMTVVVMSGDGEGGFTHYSELQDFQDADFGQIYGPFYSPGDFAVGDINKDGSLDLVSFTNYGPRIFLNDGLGDFQFLAHLENPGTQQRGRDAWLHDFDEDGHLDLVQAASLGAGPLSVRAGNGDGTFGESQRVGMVASVSSGSSRMPFADVDGDGHVDFVYGSGGIGNYSSLTATILAGRRDDLVDVVALDLNGDGNEEVLAVQEQMDRLQIFVGDNLGTFTRSNDLLTGQAPTAVAVGDLNSDGQAEMFTANRAGRSISQFSGDLESGFSGTEHAIAGSPIDIEVADINGDGFNDVLVLDATQSAIWTLAGDGSGALAAPVATSLGDRPSHFAVADANGDGNLDVIITLPDSSRVMVLPTNDGGQFSTPHYINQAAAPSHVAAVDLNDDGNPDIAATIPSLGILSVSFGLGNNQYSRSQQIKVGDFPTHLSVSDADEDGREDFVVTNSEDGTVSVVYNRFDPNEVYRYDSDAIDPDDDSLVYSIVDGPGGLIINSETGALLWAASPDQVGVHDVTLSADDGRGGTATQSFKIEVEPARENSAPIIATNPITRTGAGETFRYDASAIDNDRHPLRYRLIDGPAGATLDPVSGQLNWDGRPDGGLDVGTRGYSENGAISIPASPSLTTATTTVEGWFRYSSLPASNGAAVLFEQTNSFGVQYRLRNSFNRELTLVMNFDGAAINERIPFESEASRWTHFALVIDDAASTAALYADGELLRTVELPGPVVASGSSAAINAASFVFRGNIDNYRIWNAARTSEQIREAMGRNYASEGSLVLDYRFEDAGSLSVQDHSGNANHGYRTARGQIAEITQGLATSGQHSFTIGVEDGRGGYDQQSFTLEILPELRGNVVGHLFEDTNGDGNQDDGGAEGVPAEPNLDGWHLFIDTNGNSFPDPSEPQATTDSGGNYQFDALLPGEYPIRVSPVAGYDVPTNLTTTSVTANQDTTLDLAIEQLALSQIRGQLLSEEGDAIAYWKTYADTDNNGIRDTGEPVAMTDRNGNFAISGLDAATYTIRPDLPAGWTDTAGRDGLTVVLEANSVSTQNDFTLAPTNTSVTGGVHFVTAPSTHIEARQTFTYASIAKGISDASIAYDISLAPEGMTLDPATGLVVWRPTIAQVGEHLVVLRATDVTGSIALQDFYIEVAAPNTSPTIVSPEGDATGKPRFDAYVDFTYAYDVIAQDAESSVLTFALTEAPLGATIEPATGRLSWTPTASDLGSHKFTAVVNDEMGASSTATWMVEVSDTAPASLPLSVTLPRATAAINVNYFSRINGTDALGRPVAWSLTSGPDGFTAESDGTLRWTPAATQLGEHTVQLQASTPDGDSQDVEFSIEVLGRPANARPVITSDPLAAASIDRVFEYDIAAEDADMDTLAYTLLDGPVGMSINPSAGTVRWQPAGDQRGEHEVQVQVTDPDGLTDTQDFTVSVSRFGGPPRITSIPPTDTFVGGTYLYSVDAVDREGDPLSYNLLASPAGMQINGTTGEVSWTPTAEQLGEQDVVIQVSDGVGGATTQTFVVRAAAGASNLAPVIDSVAPRFTSVGSTYTYTVVANDPESSPLTFSLERGPAGMTVNASGLVSWTPDADQAGRHIVTLLATDAAGASGIESFDLDVLPQNSPPALLGVAPDTIAAGEQLSYDVRAMDADLDQLSFELTAGTAGALVDSFGRITWETSVPNIGSHDFTVNVTDARGGEAMQSFTIDVIEDTVPPKVSVIETLGDAARNILPWQGPFRVFVKAIDNVAIASLTLSANGQEIPLDAAGTATFTFEDWTFQNIVATATAIDTNGNQTTKTITFDYDFPEGWSGAGTEDIPTATISSPSDTESVTGMVSIIGTAAHEDLFGYKLSYRRVDETRFTEFFESTESVTDGELGIWDTSLLLNDEYVIRLEVATNTGVVNVAEHNVGLAGELKLGNFQLSFTDMVIPVAGIPIEITRIYDTLQADRQGDFGYGWRLEYRNTDLRVGLPKSGLKDIGIFTPLRPGVKVFLNVPGEGRQGFTFDPDIRVLPGFGGQNLVLARPRFTPDPGVTSTLSTGTSSYLHVNEQGELYAPGGIPYNPASPSFGGAYVLTNRVGITFRISGANGKLSSATDRNGNSLDFRADGVFRDGAELVSIARTEAGLIESITNPTGDSMLYQYSSGQLTRTSDPAGNQATFTYSADRASYLESYDSGLGSQPKRYEYDSQGRVAAIVDEDGQRTKVDFDPNDQTVTQQDALGRTTILVFDNSGNISQEVSPEGRTINRQHDSNGNVIASTDAAGRVVQMTYNTQGLPTRQIDAAEMITTFTYSSNGTDLISTTDPLGRSLHNTFDDAGNVIRSVSIEGFVTSYEYDAGGNLLATVWPDGGTQRNEYDSLGRRTLEIDSNGNTRARDFDGSGRVTSDTIKQTSLNGQAEERRVRFEYDGNGHTTRVVDAFGNSIQKAYDAAGRMVAATNELGITNSYAYNALDNLTVIGQADGSNIQREYDAAGQLISLTNALGHTTNYVYDDDGNRVETILPDSTPGNLTDNPRELVFLDSVGQATATIDANGNRTEFEYDSIGRVVLERNAAGYETRFGYDALGRRVSIVDPLGRETRVAFSRNDRLKTSYLADGSTIREEFDHRGNVVSSIDPLNQEMIYGYDNVSNLIEVIAYDGSRTEYEYDEFGNRIAATDAAGRVTKFEYDAQSRLVAKVLPLGQREETTYDAAGNRVAYQDFNGTVHEFAYDSFGRLTTSTAGTDVVVLNYNSAGQTASIVDSRGATSYQYDEIGRISRKTEPDGRTVEYTYDAVGNLLTLTSAGGVTSYQYDSLNRVARIEHSGESVEYTYDAAGNRISSDHGNGILHLRTYDSMDRIVDDIISDGTQVLEGSSSQFDATGRLASRKHSDGSVVRYSYDVNYRLQEELRTDASGQQISIRYTFDQVGNRLTQAHSLLGLTSYTYDANDQLLSETYDSVTTVYTYDENGKLLGESVNGSPAAEYQYNSRGRMTRSANRIGTADEVTVEYLYDANGDRVSKTADGVEMLYLLSDVGDYPEVVTESFQDGTLVATHVHGNDIVFTLRTDGNFHYHPDNFGSTRLITNSQGQLTDSFRYDAFGELLEPNLESDFSHLFKGEFRDFETGFDYLRARYVDVDAGRFIGRDPFQGFSESPQSQHPFLYVNADPVNLSDPSGEAITLKGVLITSAIVVTISLTSIVVVQSGIFDDANILSLKTAVNEVSTAAASVEHVIARGNANDTTKIFYRSKTARLYEELSTRATELSVSSLPGKAGGSENIAFSISIGWLGRASIGAGPFLRDLELPSAAGFVAETIVQSTISKKTENVPRFLGEFRKFDLEQGSSLGGIAKRICRIVANNNGGHKKKGCT